MATVLHDSDDLRPGVGPRPHHHRIECGTDLEAIRRWVRLAGEGHDVYLGDWPPGDYARPVYVTAPAHFARDDPVRIGYQVIRSNFPRMDTYYRFLPRSGQWERRGEGGWAACAPPGFVA